MSYPPFPLELGIPDRVLFRLIKASEPQPNGCRLLTKIKPTPHGYVSITWHNGQIRHRGYAHRLICEIVHGPIPEGWFVAHRCDTPNCINPTCLVAVLPSANHADMIAKGRSNRAEKHWNWKGGISRNFIEKNNRQEGVRL